MTNPHLKPISLTPIFLLLLPWILGSCGQSKGSTETTSEQFAIRDFKPMVNWKADQTLSLDYTEAMQKGFIIPTLRQTPDGYFDFEFRIKNTGVAAEKFAYKIYWQNESYKFPERDLIDSTKQHPDCWENFYGSWEEVNVTFMETDPIPPDHDFHTIQGKFRIVGNPRDEQRYFSGPVNDRWKRNPRVGVYSFLLVVTTPENLKRKTIPPEVQNISLHLPTGYIHPYFYFLYGAGKKLTNTLAQRSTRLLKVIANADPGAGIYINPNAFPKAIADQYKTDHCGQDSSLYRMAAFEQFIHYIDPSTKMNNIPVIEDILHGDYSRLDYNWNKRFYKKEELIAITSTVAKRPCETVISDPVNHKIMLHNPKSKFGEWQKQNVGVITRHGMTYGKWTVKCKLTELLNKNNMWNGITNAIWLITQAQSDWNFRRDCNSGGYMANYYGGQQDQRVKNVGYSEIDFEILKTVNYCPIWTLPPAYMHGIDDQHNIQNWNVPFPEEILADDDKITVACTNWDMACWDPVDFHDNCYPVTLNGKTFWAHRWDKNYRALTEKTPERDDELFGSEYYYFQIDWEPTEIYWRIGPSKDKLRVVGYVNDKVTSIANNQMLLIITQEYHNTKWWIGSAYSQDNTPFPGQDYPGEIYEVTIE